MTKVSEINPVVSRITQLRNEVVCSALEGSYKKFKTAVKESAELTLENYELAKQAGNPRISNVPLFSKAGMRIMKVMFLNFFRLKTPAEKELRKKREQDMYVRWEQ